MTSTPRSTESMNSDAQIHPFDSLNPERLIEHPPDNHSLAVFLLREESPFKMFYADLGDHDWRAAEAAYRRGDFGVMVERLGNMTKRKRIVYLKKDKPDES